MGLVFGRNRSIKMTLIFLGRIFLVLKQMSFYVACNASTFSVSVTLNYASIWISASKIVPSSFVSVIPITVASDVFAMNLISSIFGKRLFTFICKKCIHFLSNTFKMRPSIWELWGGPGFKLMSLESKSIKVNYLTWFLHLLW